MSVTNNHTYCHLLPYFDFIVRLKLSSKLFLEIYLFYYNNLFKIFLSWKKILKLNLNSYWPFFAHWLCRMNAYSIFITIHCPNTGKQKYKKNHPKICYCNFKMEVFLIIVIRPNSKSWYSIKRLFNWLVSIPYKIWLIVRITKRFIL